jgi:hypothetical protein
MRVATCLTRCVGPCVPAVWLCAYAALAPPPPSGKSHLLVACVTLLARLVAHGPGPAQILVASATNVAVDNVLLGLQESGFLDFCRVGSVKKIAKPASWNAAHMPHRLVLCQCPVRKVPTCYPHPHPHPHPHPRPHPLAHTLAHPCVRLHQLLSMVAHSRGTEASRAISDLKFMLTHGALSAADRADVSAALAKLEQKQDQVAALITRRVVGVTCAATSFGILEGRCVPRRSGRWPLSVRALCLLGGMRSRGGACWCT